MAAYTAQQVADATVEQIAQAAKDMTTQEWEDTLAVVTAYSDMFKMLQACRIVRDATRTRQAMVRDRYEFVRYGVG
jgi:hypothetical protein